MTAPPTSIIPVTMRKTNGAAPRDPVRPGASISRANHDRSAVTAHPSLVSPCTARDRIGRAVLPCRVGRRALRWRRQRGALAAAKNGSGLLAARGSRPSASSICRRSPPRVRAIRHAGAERLHLLYTFENIANVIARFAEVIGLDRFAIYVFAYGAPVGFRLAVRHPDRLTAIISQNGNAYEEGLSEGWNPIRTYWQDPDPSLVAYLRSLKNRHGRLPETIRPQLENQGSADDTEGKAARRTQPA
jgi:hypothetical protein